MHVTWDGATYGELTRSDRYDLVYMEKYDAIQKSSCAAVNSAINSAQAAREQLS